LHLKDDEFEFESLLPDKAYIDEHITTLYKRRRKWSFQSLLINREVKQKSIKCQAILQGDTTNTDRIQAGGGCNIERRAISSKDCCKLWMEHRRKKEKIYYMIYGYVI